MVYFLSFVLNIANLNPVLIRDCKQIELKDSKQTIEKHISEIQEMNMICHKKEDSLSYTCQNQEKGLVAKVLVLKNLEECKALPNKTVEDLKKLLNRK